MLRIYLLYILSNITQFKFVIIDFKLRRKSASNIN